MMQKNSPRTTSGSSVSTAIQAMLRQFPQIHEPRRPATKIAPEVLGIHIKGASARSMHGGPWYFQREFAMMVVCRTDCLLALAPASCF